MRGKKVKKRVINPDPIYSSRLVTRLINRVMMQGKKSVAAGHVYSALKDIEEKSKVPGLEVLRQALENVKPLVEVRSRRVGGAAYQVPTPVRGERRETLAIRWLIMAARARSNSQYHRFWQKLASEIQDAAKGEGEAVRKKDATHKMADANKAFAHFRW